MRYGRFEVIHPIHKCKNENHTTGFEVRNTFNDKEFAEFAKNAKFDFIKYFHFANNVDFEIQLKENPETDYEGLLLPSKMIILSVFAMRKIILGPSINVLLNCVITGRSIERKESSICFCLKETSRGGNLATGIRFNGE